MTFSTNSPSARQKLRESLVETLRFQIEETVNDEIPPDLSSDTRKAIMDEVLADSSVVLDAIDTCHLQNSELCLERHLEGVLAHVNFLIHQHEAQKGRS